MHPDAILVIPTYNEEKSLPNLFPRLEKIRSQLDIVFVDDGSNDLTKNLIEEHHFRIVSHSTNLGYRATIKTALHYALTHSYNHLAFIDADGQHDPNFVIPAIQVLKESGSDLVIGSRFIVETHYNVPLIRWWGMLMSRGVTYLLTGTLIYDTTSGFKVFNRKAMAFTVSESLGDYHAPLLVYLLHMGCRIKEISVVVQQRRFGASMYSWKSVVVYPLTNLFLSLKIFLKYRKKYSRTSLLASNSLNSLLG